MTKPWDDLAELNAVSPLIIPKNGDNLLICDGNNLGYRYIKRKNYNNFREDYLRTLDSLAKSYSADTIIVAFDFGKSYYRIEQYPEYKGTRKKPQTEEEQQYYDEFFACLNDLADNLPLHIRGLKFRGVEADDIITYLVKNLSDSFDNTWIVSSDRDIYQLLSDKVSIFNIFSRKEITQASLFEDHKVTPQEYALARIISGDDGDNIIGIEGIGEVRSCALATKYKTFEALLAALPIKGTSQYIKNLNAGKDILIRNEKLIRLLQYNDLAIRAGKDGDLALDELERLIAEYN